MTQPEKQTAPSSDKRATLRLSRRERATVLAALRFFADECLENGQEIPDSKIRQIATDGDRFEPLTLEEVTQLCEKLKANTQQHR